MSGNADQIEFWNGNAGRHWAEQQEAMDRTLASFHDAVVAFAAAKSGEHVVDIGCGSGTTSFTLSDAVGPSGQVTGVDISKPMLELARRRAAATGKPVAFVEADASVFPFTTTVDLVFSKFGVMFFDQPAKAFENIHRALKPTGRLAFVCWRAVKDNAWVAVPMSVARPFLPAPAAPPDPLAPGPFAFADSDRIKLILTEAGFRHVRVEPLDTVMHMGATIESATTQLLDVGPLSRALADVDATTRGKVEMAVREALKPYAGKDGVAIPAACWLVGAVA
jgi:SAM-dependent methyltransferase